MHNVKQLFLGDSPSYRRTFFLELLGTRKTFSLTREKPSLVGCLNGIRSRLESCKLIECQDQVTE